MQLCTVIEQLPQIVSCKTAANACSNDGYTGLISLSLPVGQFSENIELCQDPLRSQKKSEGEQGSHKSEWLHFLEVVAALH